MSEKTIQKYLDEPDLPDVDLFLRSSGGSRGYPISFFGSRLMRSSSSWIRCGRMWIGGPFGTPSKFMPNATVATEGAVDAAPAIK